MVGVQKKKNGNNNLNESLFKATDKLRKNIDTTEYKHIVFGLIFLKYIFDSFAEFETQIKEEKKLNAKIVKNLKRVKV